MTTPSGRARVLIADDHRIITDGLKLILEPVYKIAGAVTDGPALVDAARVLEPELIVADISMPLLNGLDAMLQIKKENSRVRVVLLTGLPDAVVAVRALRGGASGYVLKASAGEELLVALGEALEGRTYVTPHLAGEVLQNLMEGRGRVAEAIDELNARERVVLQLLAEGKSVKEAAAVLDISPRTIEFHKANLQDKTGIRTTAELARYAVRLGLIFD